MQCSVPAIGMDGPVKELFTFAFFLQSIFSLYYFYIFLGT